MDTITAQQLKAKIDAGEDFFLLDVREPFEQYQSKIEYENSKLISVDELNDRIDEIKEHKNEEVVCMCRSGSRSSKAVKMLLNEGFENVKNLKGGINRWAKEIDTSLPVY